MNLLNKTLELSRIYGVRPERSKGQNFLVEEEYYDQAILAAQVTKADTVLEVGPGLGFLTEKLAKTAKKVIAVELDKKLAGILTAGFLSKSIRNVSIINEDILNFRDDFFAGQNYKIVANLPYNISSIFLRKFLSSAQPPETMVLMLQKEVAERIVAQPPQMSLLALSVQFYAEAEIISLVPPTAFWPQPEVDSALIKIVRKASANQPQVDAKLFFRLLKIAYSAKRKMLKNNLANGLHLPMAEVENIIVKSGHNPKIRAQELSLENWLNLFANFSGFMV